MSLTVHVNALRWFASTDGGPEFVQSHGDRLDDATIAAALTAPYPNARHLLRTLRDAGIGADCSFTLDDGTGAAAALAPGDNETSLGGLALTVDGNHDDPIDPHAAVAGLTCTAPDPDAIPRAAQALADAFGPQVVWDDDLADVMLVQPGMTVDQIRARWSRPHAG